MFQNQKMKHNLLLRKKAMVKKLGENDSQQSSTEPNSSNAQLPKSGPNVAPTQVSPNGEINGITKK